MTLSKNNSACVHLEKAHALLVHLETSVRLGRLCCGRLEKHQGISGGATSLPGSRFPQHHLLLLIALTLSFEHGHCAPYIAHLGFIL